MQMLTNINTNIFSNSTQESKSTRNFRGYSVNMSNLPVQIRIKNDTLKYLQNSFTGRNESDNFRTGLIVLIRRWLMPNTMTFVLEQLTISPFSWNQLFRELSSSWRTRSMVVTSCWRRTVLCRPHIKQPRFAWHSLEDHW